jgi:predicted permease
MLRHFRRFFRRRKLDAELDDELRFHLDQRTRENIDAGMAPEQARRAARLAFGNPVLAKEDTRSIWTLGALERFWQDFRYAARSLAKSPGFTTIAILTLALGIGANTAIFSLTNALLLKHLPVDRPNQLVLFGSARVWGVISGTPEGAVQIFSNPGYEQFRDDNHFFTGLCAFQAITNPLAVRIPGHAGADQASGKLVSGNYFAVLGVRPALGRPLASGDDVVGAPPAAVISFRYWTRAFARDPAAVGSVVDINGTAFTIVGVAPRGFFGERLDPQTPDFWLPIATQPQVTRFASLLRDSRIRWLFLIGRLEPGVSRRQADAALTVQMRQFLSAHAGAHPSEETAKAIASARIELTSAATGISFLRFVYTKPLYVLLGIALLVLLVACTNVANLLLARATARHREISTRLALGAGRWRLARQLLAESLLLAAGGAAAGLLLAQWGTKVLTAIAFYGTRSVPFQPSLDTRVLAFTILLSAVTGILFGLAPALRVRQVNLAEALKSGSRAAGMAAAGRRRFHWGKALVVAQVALSTILLVAAGLFVRTLAQLERQDLGFDREHVLAAGVDPLIAGYKVSQLPALYQNLQRRIEALPGVRSAALALYPPEGGQWSSDISIAGRAGKPSEDLNARWLRVTPDFFKTLGMPLVLGRTLTAEDMKADGRFAVINQTMARRYFSGRNPIGQRFGFGSANEAEGRAHSGDFQIVGVVKDAKYGGAPRDEVPPTFFLPFFANAPNLSARKQALESRSDFADFLAVRTATDPLAVASELREAIRQVDPHLPVAKISTLNEQVEDAMNQEHLVSYLSACFGLLALVIAAVGLYGLMAYMAARRTAEIGLRMALGAETGAVLRMVLRQGFLLALLGIALGLIGAFAAGRWIASLLFGVAPGDPATYAAVVALLVLVALLASYLPARRAARVDPMVALRYE